MKIKGKFFYLFYLTAFFYLSFFLSTSAYALEIKFVEVDSECEADIYNRGQFKFMEFFNRFVENVKRTPEDFKTKGYDPYDTFFNLSPHQFPPDMNKKFDPVNGSFGEYNNLERTQTISGRSVDVEEYYKILFQYYHYYDGDPLVISHYSLEVFRHKGDSPLSQFSLRASCNKKDIPQIPSGNFGTWLSVREKSPHGRGGFYEYGNRMIRIKSDYSWEQETTYRFFWPDDMEVRGDPSFYCRARFKGFLSDVVDNKISLKLSQVELVESEENPEECGSLISEMNKTGMNRNAYKTPGYMESLLAVKIEDVSREGLPEGRFKKFQGSQFEKVEDQARGVTFVFSSGNKPAKEDVASVVDQMKTFGLEPGHSQENVDYRDLMNRLEGAYQWTFNWSGGIRSGLDTLIFCRENDRFFKRKIKAICNPDFASTDALDLPESSVIIVE